MAGKGDKPRPITNIKQYNETGDVLYKGPRPQGRYKVAYLPNGKMRVIIDEQSEPKKTK